MAAVDDALTSFLPTIAVFGGLAGEGLVRLIEALGVQELNAGDVVFKQGENGRSMYVVRSGEVVVYRDDANGKRTKMVRLGPGEAFGEMCLVEIQARSGTVIAQERTTLLTLHTRDLARLYEQDIRTYTLILNNIARELSRRLRRADARLCELANSSEEREQTQIRLKVARVHE